LLLGFALLFYFVLNGSERTILQSADRYRDLAGHEVAGRVTDYLNEAPMAVEHFERQVRYKLVQPENPDSTEPELVSLLLANQNISEATLTYADNRDGDLAHQAATGQISVLRSPSSEEFVCRRTWFAKGQFVSQSNTWGIGAKPAKSGLEAPAPTEDPTSDLTFTTPVRSELYGTLIWSDLHWAQIDKSLPEPERRVEVSVQKAVEDVGGRFVGVLRIGLMKAVIDRATHQNLTGGGERDPHLIFLCDNEGRLITGAGAADKVAVIGEDLRIPPADVPPVVGRALREPLLKQVSVGSPTATSSFRFGGQDYLYTFAALPKTQDWIVGIVVPRDYYLGQLLAIRRDVLRVSGVVMLAIFLIGGLIVRNVVASQSMIVRETAKMNRFEFASAHQRSWLRDIEDVLAGLEKAKTAMRAMSKYVPVNLVRRLYRDGQEPVLGGKAAEISLLFSDIKGFTSFSESIPPDRLAEILGLYLHAVTAAIQGQQGTIDKYIGDSVMALWNVPEETPGHEVLACRAALRCRDALRQLYDSPAWGDAPRFETRFGIHRCVCSVGHFGSPDRFSYTAIGDGVNLASRLEGLNKFYDTTLVASEAIYERAKDYFEFRLLDRVAVSGKTLDLTIYELIGDKKDARAEYILNYERAFNAYRSGNFAMALEALSGQTDDGPSRMLAKRCRSFVQTPPEGWRGVWVFDNK
jgi:adenylate cyclase